MYKPGDLIDGKYHATGICSDTGGMGVLLFVNPIAGKAPGPLVLKYCKHSDPETALRFAREARLMREFAGNDRVVQIVDANLECEPPYFVMKFFTDGDLTTIAASIRADLARQETVLNQMIDCISELHAQNIYHRDIKPQNFLREGDAIRVSDLGLSTDIEPGGGFTRSSKFWGTPGYVPPEFLARGGFKSADASSDVFMLGKTFYALLSDRDPTYLTSDGIPGALFAIIERCCVPNKDGRYQSLASLRQSLTAAYAVLQGRVVGPSLATTTLRSIIDRLRAVNKYHSVEVQTFIEQLSMLELEDKIQICLELPEQLFQVLSQQPLQGHLHRFLESYSAMAEHGNYGWSFAEVIANNMRKLFDSPDVSAANKAFALKIAIESAARQNRFAAMDTCRAMIISITDDELAQRVHDLIVETGYGFIWTIQQSTTKHPTIRAALAKKAVNGASG